MRRLSMVFISALFLVLLPAVAAAQADLCVPSLPQVPNEAKAEQLRIEAMERAQREAERRNWEVKMFTVKNALPSETLRALCIFRIEVANQPALRLVQVRAPKELMAAVEDAINRLDTPPRVQVVKGIELTGYVLVALDAPDPKFQQLPPALRPVATQLSNILPSGATLALADTFVLRGMERQSVRVSGFTNLSATASIRDTGGASVVYLSGLSMTYVIDDASGNRVNFDTNVEIPQNSQVVVGKATPNKQGSIKAVVLVMTAKILD